MADVGLTLPATVKATIAMLARRNGRYLKSGVPHTDGSALVCGHSCELRRY
jgi:hypothetical protein